MGKLRQALEGVRIEAQVQDRVHHARHGEFGAGAYRNQEWLVCLAELLTGFFFDVAERVDRLVPHPLGKALAGCVVRIAGLGRDREAGRDRQTRTRHFGDAGALAPEQIPQILVSLFEEVDPLLLGGSVRRLRGLGGDSHCGILLKRRSAGDSEYQALRPGSAGVSWSAIRAHRAVA